MVWLLCRYIRSAFLGKLTPATTTPMVSMLGYRSSRVKVARSFSSRSSGVLEVDEYAGLIRADLTMDADDFNGAAALQVAARRIKLTTIGYFFNSVPFVEISIVVTVSRNDRFSPRNGEQ